MYLSKKGKTEDAYIELLAFSLTANSYTEAGWSYPVIKFPLPEVCDGIDNDWDGQVDENLSRSCDNACGSGTEICQNGNWVGCTAPPPPEDEVCNGQDDDCDGKTDEDFILCEGDFDKDGDTDGSDLAVFGVDFGKTNCCFYLQ